ADCSSPPRGSARTRYADGRSLRADVALEGVLHPIYDHRGAMPRSIELPQLPLQRRRVRAELVDVHLVYWVVRVIVGVLCGVLPPITGLDRTSSEAHGRLVVCNPSECIHPHEVKGGLSQRVPPCGNELALTSITRRGGARYQPVSRSRSRRPRGARPTTPRHS